MNSQLRTLSMFPRYSRGSDVSPFEMYGFSTAHGRGRSSHLAICAQALALLWLLSATPSAAAATRGLNLGFGDSVFNGTDSQRRGAGLDDARAVGARIIRLELRWAGVARTRPRDGADPDDPAYRWHAVDAAALDAIQPLIALLSPVFRFSWAVRPIEPSSAPPGTWLPDPRAFGQFAEAAARRYRRVTHWQVWNEPNLWYYLSPQWTRANGRLIAGGAGHYRLMPNAAMRTNRVTTPSQPRRTAHCARSATLQVATGPSQ